MTYTRVIKSVIKYEIRVYLDLYLLGGCSNCVKIIFTHVYPGVLNLVYCVPWVLCTLVYWVLGTAKSSLYTI